MSDNIPSLRGFDLDAALQRLRGRWDILKPVLISFCENNETTYAQFEEFLQTENYPEAIRIAHRLKGSGANIGADSLSKCAAAIEAQLKAGDFKLVTEQVQTFKIELDYLSEAKILLSAADSSSSEKNAGVVSLADVKKTLTEVNDNIESDISKSLQTIQKLSDQCKGTPFEHEIVNIGTQFNQFKLNDAKISISKFINEAK